MSHTQTARRQQVEAHYCKSPFVKECCVLALHEPDQPGHEQLYAVVVPNMDLLRTRKIVNAGDLLRFELEGLSHALPPHERVQAYEIWFEPLPRTRTQDIDRPAVERRIRARQLAHVADAAPTAADHAWLEHPDVTAVLPLIQARQKTNVRVRPDSNLELDIGLDSMERVELLTELEQHFRITIPPPVATEIYTVRQLIDAVRSAGPLAANHRSGVRKEDRDASEPWAGILKERSDYAWLLRRRTFASPILFVLFRVVHVLFFRARVKGLDKLPATGPFIVAPNHQSYIDPFVLGGVLPYRVFKDLFLVGAPEYFETAFTRWVARTANLVPVDPDSNLVPAMQAAAYGLARGKILLLFPEGERSIDGTVKKFKKGAPMLAQHLNVPIVPVALKGTYEVWPRNRAINWRVVAPWSRHRVRIEFGDPTLITGGGDYRDAAAALRERVNAMWEALSS